MVSDNALSYFSNNVKSVLSRKNRSLFKENFSKPPGAAEILVEDTHVGSLLLVLMLKKDPETVA